MSNVSIHIFAVVGVDLLPKVLKERHKKSTCCCFTGILKTWFHLLETYVDDMPIFVPKLENKDLPYHTGKGCHLDLIGPTF